MIRIKRVYEPGKASDGYRVLVDRVWPRGIRRDAVDDWMKDIAPSTALRKWFNHEPEKWEAFRSRYIDELTENGDLLVTLKALEEVHGTLTLLFGARDTERNQAVVLQELLSK